MQLNYWNYLKNLFCWNLKLIYIKKIKFQMSKKGAATKADKKKQEKVIEDKTFGLKNKNKSKAVQKYFNS